MKKLFDQNFIENLLIPSLPNRDYYRAELDCILNAVVEAMEVCESIANSGCQNPSSKNDLSPVTIADYTSQYIITREIQKSFPNEMIIAEEDLEEMTLHQTQLVKSFLPTFEPVNLNRTDPTPNRFWTIDPIDGTKGYIRGGQYSVCVALIEDEKVVLGVLGCPRLQNFKGTVGTIFMAVHGSMGAFEIALPSLDVDQLYQRNTKIDEETTIESVEQGHTKHEFTDDLRRDSGITNTIRMDSQCKYGLVARGEGTYIRKPAKSNYLEKIWDHAPGSFIVERAGGEVTDFQGERLNFHANSIFYPNVGIIACPNPIIHEKILSNIKNLLKP